MKIILSRKGFDSSAGGQASPIMPNGTLLSLPIPDKSDKDKDTFGSLVDEETQMSYYEIISSLKPKSILQPDSRCHLDPDLRRNVKARPEKWQPAFGQCETALSALKNNNVSVGDIFIFFGWFKDTEMHNGGLRYKPKAPDLHVIYGYMQIGKIIEKKEDVPNWLDQHPHVGYDLWEKGQNAIYLPAEHLSLNPQLPGCGTLKFRADRVLTKEGMTRTRWNLPEFFKQVSIYYHPNPWRDDYFQSVARGQEFVLEPTSEILEWVKQIITD